MSIENHIYVEIGAFSVITLAALLIPVTGLFVNLKA